MRKVIGSPFFPRTNKAVSPALISGDFIFLSGITSDKEDIQEAMQECLKIANSLLREAQSNLNELVRITYYIAPSVSLEDIDDVIKEKIEEPYPTRSVIYVDEGINPTLMIDCEAHHVVQTSRCASCQGCPKGDSTL